jgi:hypothetical protein
MRRLVDAGYAVAIDSGYLVVRDVPYLDAELRLQTGAIVAKLVFVDQERVTQDDHQIWFAGSTPYGLDGKPIPNLAGGPTGLALGEASKDVVVQRRFSNKPKGADGFPDFFAKIESYATINFGLGGPELWRKSAILADAALAIFTREPSARGGQAFIDEALLREEGVTDFSKYQCVPGIEPPHMPFSAIPRAPTTVKG